MFAGKPFASSVENTYINELKSDTHSFGYSEVIKFPSNTDYT